MAAELNEITAQATLRGMTRMTVTRLICLASPDAKRVGRPIIMPSSKVSVTRATETSGPFSFVDHEISRVHASFEPGIRQPWRIIDSGSRNGTFVDGRRVQNHELSSGNVIRFGSTLLLYQELVMDAGEVLKGKSETLGGSSLAIQRVIDSIHQIAQSTMPVLVHGETGVGKELVAKEIHLQSKRPGSFISVNCGAFAPEIAASELFGHAAGSFTGAHTQSDGLFRSAEGGTLFLDEIGELPLSLQPLLLRVLSTGHVRPVGDSRSRPLDVRIVAATNRSLDSEVRAGAFRADLHARLTGWQIGVPPLRERRDDILDLARHFSSRAGSFVPFHPDLQEALATYDWPYNIRELEHVIQSAVTRLAGHPMLDLIHVSQEVAKKIEKRFATAQPTLTPLIARVRREGTPTKTELEIALKHFAGSVGQVATFFGKDRKQVYRWANSHGIEPAEFR